MDSSSIGGIGFYILFPKVPLGALSQVIRPELMVLMNKLLSPLDGGAFPRLSIFLWPMAAILALLPWVDGTTAFLGGALLALTLGNPHQDRFRRWIHPLLGWSVVGLGAGMDLGVVLKVGLRGLGASAVSIALTLAFGIWLARRMGVRHETGLLISVGTAICGGSAIAAVAPVIGAEEQEISVALGMVFLLNAMGLIAFPLIGRALHLSQDGFGWWAALGIHDTSSVVGAALAYGHKALEVAVPVKLARVLWIVPVAMGLGLIRKEGLGTTKGHRPWFILGFLVAAGLATHLPALRVPARWIARGAEQGLVLTLFLVGAGLTPQTLRKIGVRPFLHGMLLWGLVGVASLGAVLAGVL